MLEIRRGTAAKNYENTFFREFAENLEKLFNKYSIDGLLIANSECEAEKRLQIDALLITNNIVCIIDFKNFGGKIKLPGNAKSEFEFGRWTNDSGEIIKGGSSINPYIQLRNQKERFVKVCKNKIIPNLQREDQFNPYHTIRMVCFQKPIDLIGSIPSKDELNFFIVDQSNYLEKIKDVIDIEDKEVKLSQDSFVLFKEIFRADKFDIKETYSETISFESYSSQLEYDSLLPDQKSALQEITEFIQSDTDKVFVLQGTSLSGKTYLIPFIENVAYNNNIPQVELFASSGRVAKNLLSESNLKFNSLYSYIYGGTMQEAAIEDEVEIVEDHEEEDQESLKLEIVPLKKNDNEEKALFIVDEAQLVSDSYYRTEDLRFGSGRLLKDFIKFSELNNSGRKIIFIGDNYHLTTGKKGEDALNPLYFKEEYDLETKAYQLIDKGEKSEIVKQGLVAVNAIREESFNQLSFDFSDKIQNIEKDEITSIVRSKLDKEVHFHLLTYTRADAQKVNSWIKRKFIKNGTDIAPKDLVLFNNNFTIEDVNDPFAEPRKVYNGQFGTVLNVSSEIIPETVSLKGKSPVTLNFREITIILKDTRYSATILSLENYRLSESEQLSKDELIAYNVILNREIKKEITRYPFESSELYNHVIQSKEYKDILDKIKSLQEELNRGERVKTKLENFKIKKRRILKSSKRKHRKEIERKLYKDTSSKYYKYKNAAYIRFGWALNVHKSRSYKWDEVIFNVSFGENAGKTNENYFRFIYTGLTRAKNRVGIINYEAINPFIKMVFKDSNVQKKPNKKIYFIVNSDNKITNEDYSIIKQFNFSDDNIQLLQLFHLLKPKLALHEIKISSINHHPYQELYHLSAGNDKSASISFYYNRKGHIKFPTIQKGVSEEFGSKVIEILTSNNNLIDFSFISDRWRESVYTNMNRELIKHNMCCSYIIQTLYKDTLKVYSADDELVVDMYYDGDNFYSSIIATYYSNDKIWNSFKDILETLKNKYL